MRDPQYSAGRRKGIKWAIAWLHARADEMNDPHAKQVLNSAAFNMGVDAKSGRNQLIMSDQSGEG